MGIERASVLIVDDESAIRDIIRTSLEGEGHSARCVANVLEARQQLIDNTYDLVITDLSMPGENGIELVRHVRRATPKTAVLVVTAYPDSQKVEQMEELEVSAFLVKPFTVRQLKYSVLSALRTGRTSGDNEHISDTVALNNDFGLVGVSSYVQAQRNRIPILAEGVFPVLIQGESGTGKEIIAHAIHNQSARSNENMIIINCAAIPQHLEEAEFFGYARGAFTGAHASKRGILESADKSTVFLDEIGELSPTVQAKLLRVLDTGEYNPVGHVEPKRVDIRIVSATNRDLETMVEEGTFRKDLYYRLKGGLIETIPLEEHNEDIPFLIRHFIDLRGADKEVTQEALQLLTNRPWPGNIRELKHAVDHLCALAKNEKRINSTIVLNVLKEGDPVTPTLPFNRAKEEFEREYFSTILRKHGGNLSRAAREAGIHRPNLIRKLKEIGISADEYRNVPVNA